MNDWALPTKTYLNLFFVCLQQAKWVSNQCFGIADIIPSKRLSVTFLKMVFQGEYHLLQIKDRQLTQVN